MPVPRAEIPLRATLHAEILGVDKDSYFHLNILDLKLIERYNVMAKKMNLAVQLQLNASTHQTWKPETYCIVHSPGQKGGDYTRAYIVKECATTKGIFSCYLIDDLSEIEVKSSDIFEITEEILNFPCFALKCKLVGMDCFIGSPILKSLYDIYINGKFAEGRFHCIVKILNRRSPTTPTIEITNCNGTDLAESLQQYLSSSLKFTYPEKGDAVLAKILHCDDQGIFWFRPWGANGTTKIIKQKLASFRNNLNRPSVSVDKRKQSTSKIWWKEYYFNGAGQLYLYTNPVNLKCYRVRLLDVNPEAFDMLILVLLIDYGSQLYVSINHIIELDKVDPNLCFIPPQCLPGTFVGANCVDRKTLKFDFKKFYKFTDNSPVSVVIKGYCWSQQVNGELQYAGMTPIVDILIRNPAPYAIPEHPGHSLGEIFHLTECGSNHDDDSDSEDDWLHAYIKRDNEDKRKLERHNDEDQRKLERNNNEAIPVVVMDEEVDYTVVICRRNPMRIVKVKEQNSNVVLKWIYWALGKHLGRWSGNGPVGDIDKANNMNDPEY